MLQAGKPLVAAFASLGQLSGRGMKINSLGIKLSSSRYVLVIAISGNLTSEYQFSHALIGQKK